jgi:hypothetical protein
MKNMLVVVYIFFVLIMGGCAPFGVGRAFGRPDPPMICLTLEGIEPSKNGIHLYYRGGFHSWVGLKNARSMYVGRAYYVSIEKSGGCSVSTDNYGASPPQECFAPDNIIRCR